MILPFAFFLTTTLFMRVSAVGQKKMHKMVCESNFTLFFKKLQHSVVKVLCLFIYRMTQTFIHVKAASGYSLGKLGRRLRAFGLITVTSDYESRSAYFSKLIIGIMSGTGPGLN